MPRTGGRRETGGISPRPEVTQSVLDLADAPGQPGELIAPASPTTSAAVGLAAAESPARSPDRARARVSGDEPSPRHARESSRPRLIGRSALEN